jgi:hypothetical protein
MSANLIAYSVNDDYGKRRRRRWIRMLIHSNRLLATGNQQGLDEEVVVNAFDALVRLPPGGRISQRLSIKGIGKKPVVPGTPYLIPRL